jgi:release factor glutamine methyltransferase
MKINEALDEANLILKKNLIKSAKLDSEILMAEVIQKDRKYIILNLGENLKPKIYKNFQYLIEQRSKGKPIAYLLGKKDFWKYEFKVGDNILIPRPDTEIIIDQILRITKFKSKLNILDIGVGSGCILLSILKEKKNFYGTGIDISKKCTDIAKINAFNLGLLNRVRFFKSDVDNFNYGKYDLIISNPPYINRYGLKYLEKDIVNFEPKLALDGGLEGLSEISKVIKKSSELIKKNGKLVLEIAFDQKNKVKRLLFKKGFYINKVIKDYAKNDRCIISTKLN